MLKILQLLNRLNRELPCSSFGIRKGQRNHIKLKHDHSNLDLQSKRALQKMITASLIFTLKPFDIITNVLKTCEYQNLIHKPRKFAVVKAAIKN